MNQNKSEQPWDQLLEIMAKLRGPGGCPWDHKQTHQTLKPYLVEECYELLDAIERNNREDILEELGDVLLQVIFHAQIAKEANQFDITEVIQQLSDKLIRRHPHVFDKASAPNAETALANWEKVKQQEKQTQGKAEGSLASIPPELPALLMAYRMGQKAGKHGLDFSKIEEIWQKVEEELQEVKQCTSPASYEEELGDLLFAISNLCRFTKTNPEIALRKSCQKFKNRFHYMENKATQLNKQLNSMSYEELEKWWQEAKTSTKAVENLWENL